MKKDVNISWSHKDREAQGILCVGWLNWLIRLKPICASCLLFKFSCFRGRDWVRHWTGHTARGPFGKGFSDFIHEIFLRYDQSFIVKCVRAMGMQGLFERSVGVGQSGRCGRGALLWVGVCWIVCLLLVRWSAGWLSSCLLSWPGYRGSYQMGEQLMVYNRGNLSCS